MKRYLLFKGDDHYPNDGWEDFVGDYDTIIDAKTRAQSCDWWQIVDTETGKIARQFPPAEE